MQERHLYWPHYFYLGLVVVESPLHQSIPVATGLDPPELPISDEA